MTGLAIRDTISGSYYQHGNLYTMSKNNASLYQNKDYIVEELERIQTEIQTAGRYCIVWIDSKLSYIKESDKLLHAKKFADDPELLLIVQKAEVQPVNLEIVEL
jgi:hypothetical protein